MYRLESDAGRLASDYNPPLSIEILNRESQAKREKVIQGHKVARVHQPFEAQSGIRVDLVSMIMNTSAILDSSKMREEPDDEPFNHSSPNLVVDTETHTHSNDRALFHYVPTVPFLTNLHEPSKFKKEKITESIMDTLKQVKVNIPLLDVIKQVPMYAKFLKDLWTQKHKLRLHMNKQMWLTEHVSSILLGHIPPKLKYPSATTITCLISEYTIDKALLYLRASVNLLPYSVYKQFNLRELKPTLVTLSFTDRLVKRPQGVIEDIFMKVEEFYYPVDFIVLDIEPFDPTKDLIPILLK
ncbi:uncharacterized protein LOC131153742 [Malania oleifera]|uniref:uncharacterized protein LOC131153742 n=1 Tax=Malania oleifera TaxID=397392 RepID=UPI0025AE712E|nr:uncharacterized protein LOC131153742 [Malania oleifera]